jgi:tRNA threonylcarbamoyladenosine biosynthesis protein TsaE
MRFHSRSPEDTRKLGERIGKCLQAGDILLLFGELGAGKTTLIQGITAGLEVAPDQYVRSPSFTLINEYKGRLPIYHVDLYRIESTAELADLGLEDYFFGEGVTLVEWGEKLFPRGDTQKAIAFGIEKRVDVLLEIPDSNGRIITLNPIPKALSSHPLFALQ